MTVFEIPQSWKDVGMLLLKSVLSCKIYKNLFGICNFVLNNSLAGIKIRQLVLHMKFRN